MGHWDEVCFICGVAPIGPKEFTTDLDLAVENFVDSLLEHFPNILSTMSNVDTKDDLQSFLITILEQGAPDDLEISSAAFENCIAVGYFDNDGATPREIVGDSNIKFRFPDGEFVETRLVDYPNCGEFWQEVFKMPNPDTGEVEEVREENISRTSANFQDGFGNFFLSECCLRFLEGWIDYARLPLMWDGRCLSFVGELWEIVNSRETGRC